MLVLQEVPPEDLSSLLEFLYCGRVSVTQSRLPSFLRAAAALRVHGLTEGANNEQPSRPKKRKAASTVETKSKVDESIVENEEENEETIPTEFLTVKQEDVDEKEEEEENTGDPG